MLLGKSEIMSHQNEYKCIAVHYDDWGGLSLDASPPVHVITAASLKPQATNFAFQS